MSVKVTPQDRRGVQGVAGVPSGVINRNRLESCTAPEKLLAVSKPSVSLLPQRRAATDGSVARQSVREATQIEKGREPLPPQGAEFIGIPEWCRRVGCSRESGYRAARRDEIPGLFRIGRLKRVNWLVFVNATGQSNLSGTARP